MTNSLTDCRYDISLTLTEASSNHELFNGCVIRETPQYLEIIPNHVTQDTRYIFPWNSIRRLTLTELPQIPGPINA
jgi:hypothetical protein